MNFKKYFEDTTSADIAQATPGSKIQRRERKCECGGRLNEELLCEKCGKQAVSESPVGKVGRTGYVDADDHITTSPKLRAEFRKLVKQIGGKTVARKLLATMNGAVSEKVSDSDTTKLMNALTSFQDKCNSNDMEAAIDEVLDLLDTVTC